MIILLISLKATNYKNKVRKQTNIKYVIFDKDDTNIDQPGNVAWFHRQSRQPICSYDCAFCIANGVQNSHRCVYTNIILYLLIFPHDAEIYLASIIFYIYIYIFPTKLEMHNYQTTCNFTTYRNLTSTRSIFHHICDLTKHMALRISRYRNRQG